MSDREYRERRSRVPGAVIWTLGPTPPGSGRVLPDGCMDLMWADGTLLVAGPDTVATSGGGPVSYIGLRFAPGRRSGDSRRTCIGAA